MSPTITNQPVNSQSSNPSGIIDVRGIISLVTAKWYLFVLSVIICFTLAALYAHYASRNWSISSKILVEDSRNSPSSLASTSGLGADFSSVFNVKSSADNEVQILKSRSLMEKTVKELQLNVRIYKKSGFSTKEIYQESPFSVTVKYKTDTVVFDSYKITFKNNSGQYTISNSDKDINIDTKLNEEVPLEQYSIKLNGIAGKKLTGEYAISVESVDAAIGAINQNFIARLSDKQSTTIDLSLNYPHPKKGEVILEELMNLYLLSSLQNKVKIADNTIRFIDTRIGLVGDELNDVEQKFEEYRIDKGITDISAQSKTLVGSQNEYYDKLNQQETQLRIFKELEKILNDPKNKSTVPSSMVAPSDAAFGQGITSYNNLLIERDRATLAYTNDNPIIKNFDQQIETARKSLLKSVEAYKTNLLTSKAELEKQNGNVNSKLQKFPAKERGYLDFQRKQALKQDLYLYLLQKREEIAISKTSTISSSRVIDHAKSDFSPFKPKTSVIRFVGILLGLIIPSIWLFLVELLNVKIKSKQDIENITKLTIAGEIGHNLTQESLVAVNNSRSVISEQFRSMRTKLNYLITSSKSNVILFTSSMGGEGKSFLSVNLGSALALTGKKVVFIELDLRKPKLSEIMGHDHNVFGYSNYIVSEFTDVNKLVKPVWFNENCSIISSGPIPPNPTELLASPKLATLIDELKAKFDYVIIDCAPIGLVTDALLIEKFADLTFYVVRENFTYKSQINIANELKDNNQVKNLYLILNDIKSTQDGYSAYGYGLNEKKNWKNRLFKFN